MRGPLQLAAASGSSSQEACRGRVELEQEGVAGRGLLHVAAQSWTLQSPSKRV